MEKSTIGIESEIEPFESFTKVNCEGMDLRSEDVARSFTHKSSRTRGTVGAIADKLFVRFPCVEEMKIMGGVL